MTAASNPTGAAASPRKELIRALADRQAGQRQAWIDRNAYFHAEDAKYFGFLVPPGRRVLQLGCGLGNLLAALRPARGVGVDFSPRMIEEARSRHPALEFHLGDIEDTEALARLQGPFDAIILADAIGDLEDVQATAALLHGLCDRDTRIIVAYHAPLWQPILVLGEKLGLRMPSAPQNWLSVDDVAAILDLAGFEIIRRDFRQLVPRRLFGLGALVNRFLASLPVLRRLCLRHYVVVRSRRQPAPGAGSVSVVIPCRNERGNIEPAVRRLPRFADDIEIIFVEGHSRDGTLEEINRVKAAYPDRDIKVLVQDGKGKGDAVRKGFAAARGDYLMILDADLTVPPEALPKFHEVLVSGMGEFVNGTRLVYPMEAGAMRPLNFIANRGFSVLFTWLLNQRITDTLCGTKVLSRAHYQRIADGRDYFGDFDPFGDFDLIFGAAKLNLKLIEVPIRYAERRYGETQISRFRHGWMLLRMVAFAFLKLKAF